jgi:hypothetical protein
MRQLVDDGSQLEWEIEEFGRVVGLMLMELC